MLDARFSQLYFGPSLNALQYGLPVIADLLVIIIIILDAFVVIFVVTGIRLWHLLTLDSSITILLITVCHVCFFINLPTAQP